MAGLPLPALSTDAQAFVDDHDGYTFTTPGNGAPYRALVRSYPHIADAMDYNSLDPLLQTAIWDAIDAAVELGYVDDVAVPAAHPSSVYTTPGPYTEFTTFTKTEAINTHAAKIAHALWLEVNETFPWRLPEYSETELRLLFDPTELYYIWDLDGATPAQVYWTCDHSPKSAYDIAVSAVGTPRNEVAALDSLILWGQTYTHYIQGTDPEWSVTLDESEVDKISRQGCPTGSRLMAAVARSINIPAKKYLSKYATGSHTNVAFFGKFGGDGGRVLYHGDDMYSGFFNDVPGHRRCASYADWIANVYPLTGTPLDEQSRGDQSRKALAWPSTTQRFFFTESLYLWPYIRSVNAGSFFPPYITYQEQTQFYDNLSTITGEAGLPPKPSASNTGTSGALSPTSGRTITASISDEDITGPIVVDANNVVIDNCRITAGFGEAVVTINAGRSGCRITNCELTGGTTGIQGTPSYVNKVYIHGNFSNAVNLTSPGTDPKTDFYYNFIEADLSCFTMSTGLSNGARIRWNTLVSTSSSSPAVSVNGDISGGVDISGNWIGGGNYAIRRNTTSGALAMDNNRFARTSATGLFQNSAGGNGTWYDNRYEDDETTANQGDTAPL